MINTKNELTNSINEFLTQQNEYKTTCACGAAADVVKCDFLPWGERGAQILGVWHGFAVYCPACNRIKWANTRSSAMKAWAEGNTCSFDAGIYQNIETNGDEAHEQIPIDRIPRRA